MIIIGAIILVPFKSSHCNSFDDRKIVLGITNLQMSCSDLIRMPVYQDGNPRDDRQATINLKAVLCFVEMTYYDKEVIVSTIQVSVAWIYEIATILCCGI